jgi:hypothetical protein
MNRRKKKKKLGREQGNNENKAILTSTSLMVDLNVGDELVSSGSCPALR